MRLISFLGSPRPNGNSDILAGKVMDGARSAGVEVQRVELRGLDINPCSGCGRCWKDGRPCIYRDDMTALYASIARSDVLLFATPVYWYGPTALMKGFMDRLVVFNRPQGKPDIDGKAALLVTVYEEEGRQAAEPLLKMFELSFRYLGLRFLDSLLVDGTGPKGAVLSKPQALERAAAIGRSLAQARNSAN
jgi:multimeric flavodoxin WrbA